MSDDVQLAGRSCVDCGAAVCLSASTVPADLEATLGRFLAAFPACPECGGDLVALQAD